jgi:hypothetical protein
MLSAPIAVQIIAPAPDVSALEKRVLARPPSLADALTDWRGFPDRVNAWLGDRFGLRGALLALYVRLDKAVETGAERSAVRGDDGWLFATTGDSLRSHVGRRPFVDGESDAWLGGVAGLAEAAREVGAAFVVLIPPDKKTVYAEKLSDYPRSIPGETRRETLLRRAPERGLALVSPAAELEAAKAEGDVYHRTDTHWNDRGAWVAYGALMATARAAGVAAEPLDPARLTWRPEQGFVGDIYGLLGEANGAPETRERAVIADSAVIEETVALPELCAEGFDCRRFVMRPRGRPRVLVLGDSFADALLPYLRESFDEVTVLHHRFGAVPREAIEPGRYDLVVLEMVERFLNRPLEAPVEAEPE